jgi:hypothetical protein
VNASGATSGDALPDVAKKAPLQFTFVPRIARKPLFEIGRKPFERIILCVHSPERVYAENSPGPPLPVAVDREHDIVDLRLDGFLRGAPVIGVERIRRGGHKIHHKRSQDKGSEFLSGDMEGPIAQGCGFPERRRTLWCLELAGEVILQEKKDVRTVVVHHRQEIPHCLSASFQDRRSEIIE